MIRLRCTLLSLGLTALALAGAPCAGGQEKPHPRLHHALYELREAKTELREAKHDFGGYRVKALKNIEAAIEQCEKALKYAGDNRPFKGEPRPEVVKKFAQFPHIHQAIVELRATVVELQEAKHDYGGHRRQAIVEINAALEQLQLCLKFARSK